jgi:hypothetical protein
MARRLSPTARKLLWFVAIYLASVLVVAGVAYGLHALLIP